MNTYEKITIAVHWQLTPIQLQFKVLLQWTPPEKNLIYINNIQLQQGGCCPFIRMRVFKPHNEPYYMEIESDTIEYDILYDTLSKHCKSLKLESTFQDKLEKLLDYLEDQHLDRVQKIFNGVIKAYYYPNLN